MMTSRPSQEGSTPSPQRSTRPQPSEPRMMGNYQAGVLAFFDPEVAAVERGGLHGDDHLTRRGHGIGHFLKLQRLVDAGEHESFHGRQPKGSARDGKTSG